jgi:acetyl esterase/lipase
VGQAPSIAGATAHVYKTIGNVKLTLYVYQPKRKNPSSKRPAAVFFFGGSWNGGTPRQFQEHASYLASRGMVGIVADYRVKTRQGTSPFECVEDGKSAIRWLRANADRLGIDSDRLAAGGGSAGGHVAAATATVPGLDAKNDDLKLNARPNALLLFNPVYDNGPGGFGHSRVKDRYREISPIHNIHKGMPPAIVFLGTQDKLVPVETGQAFKKKMEEAGSRSELFLYQDQPHGFFNRSRSPRHFLATVTEMDRFLTSLGYLEGPPTIRLEKNN